MALNVVSIRLHDRVSSAPNAQRATDTVAALHALAQEPPFGFADVSAVREYHGKAADFNSYEVGTLDREILVDLNPSSDEREGDVIGFWVSLDHKSANGFTLGLGRFGRARTWSCDTGSDNLLPMTLPECGGIEGFIERYTVLLTFFAAAQERGLVKSFSDETGFKRHRDPDRLREVVRLNLEQVAALFGRLSDEFPGGRVTSYVTAFPDFEHLEADGRRGEPPA
jgi:hypothetical protein